MEPAALDDLDHPDSVWNRAAAFEAAEHGDPLCCRSEWQLSFHENVAPEQRVVVRASDDSIAAFALHREPRLGPVLTPLEWSWKFGRPVLGPSGIELLRLLLEDLADLGVRPAVLMTGVVPGSPGAEAVVRAFRGWTIWPQEEQEASVASLEGGLDGYLSRRSGLLRRNLRKAERRAEAAGVRFERCTPGGAAEADDAYARALAVEARSWKGRESTGVLEPAVREFYRRLLVRLARAGIARIVFARDENAGVDVGFLFGGLTGGVFRAQQFSFDDRWRAHSIGNLLQLAMLRWLCEHDARCYHMGPTMEYKPHWAEERRVIGSLLFLPA